MSLTREAYDQKWSEVYQEFWRKTGNGNESLLLTVQRMRELYGPPPPEDARPPFWLHLVASLSGVSWDMITKIWDWLNGKKLIIGAIITLLAELQVALLAAIPAIQAAFPSTSKIVVWSTAGVGALGTIVGLGHKLYKFIYHEEHA